MTMGMTPGSRPTWARRSSAGLAWALWMLVVLGLTVTPGLNQLARQAGRSDLGSDSNTAIYGLVAVSAATVGAVLASRRPRHPVGWLLLALGLWFIYGYASWVLLAWRGAPPAVGLAILDTNVVAIPALIGFILLLTPTGSLPSPAGGGGPGSRRPRRCWGWCHWRWGRSGGPTSRSPTRSLSVPWLVRC